MKNRLLADHKKKGKIFQPPILSLGTFVETSWLDFAIPEFIWIQIFCEEAGFDEGSTLFLEFTKISDNILMAKTNNGIASTLISSYSILHEAEKSEIMVQLQKQGLLPRLKYFLTSFLSLYPMCPLNFILDDGLGVNPDRSYLLQYKKHLSKIIDKTSLESTLVMANVINFLNHLNRFQVAKETNIPQFKKVLDYPKTEDSQRIASFLRSSISIGFNTDLGYDRENEWIKYFWNQNLRLEPFLL
jgi:hypothetical protein